MNNYVCILTDCLFPFTADAVNENDIIRPTEDM